MLARPQMHHRALSSPGASAPFVAIFTLLKKSEMFQLHKCVLASCSRCLWFITPLLIQKASGHENLDKHESPDLL